MMALRVPNYSQTHKVVTTKDESGKNAADYFIDLMESIIAPFREHVDNEIKTGKLFFKNDKEKFTHIAHLAFPIVDAVVNKGLFGSSQDE